MCYDSLQAWECSITLMVKSPHLLMRCGRPLSRWLRYHSEVHYSLLKVLYSKAILRCLNQWCEDKETHPGWFMKQASPTHCLLTKFLHVVWNSERKMTVNHLLHIILEDISFMTATLMSMIHQSSLWIASMIEVWQCLRMVRSWLPIHQPWKSIHKTRSDFMIKTHVCSSHTVDSRSMISTQVIHWEMCQHSSIHGVIYKYKMATYTTLILDLMWCRLTLEIMFLSC